MYWKLDTYVSSAGVKIEILVSAKEEFKLPTKFVGVAHMMSDYGISDVRFEIPVLSIEEALEKYDEYLKIFSDNMRKKMEEKHNKPEIIVPDQEVSV